MACQFMISGLVPNMQIRDDDLSGPEIRALLKFHLADAFDNSPPDSVFALDITALQGTDISFWTIWEDGILLGCGALKQLTKTHGEIKSMRTASTAFGRGVGSKVLTHIIAEAKSRGMTRLSLETGENEAYAPARALYAKFDFKACGPFANYPAGDFSVFMDLNL